MIQLTSMQGFLEQASKAMRKYFRCKQLSLRAKRLIDLAIPMNLILWEAELWVTMPGA
jgi:hypothetical protein